MGIYLSTSGLVAHVFSAVNCLLMDLPLSNDEYVEQEYWNRRYKEEDEFDWFSSYETLKPLIKETVSINDSILMLGCGNSTLSADMYNDGYPNITNIDYSEIVIENMKHKYSQMANMTWQVLDIRNLDDLAQEFNVVLEKGTLDALLAVEKDPWFISPETETIMKKILLQISRKLKPGGRFISITFAQPHFRKLLYARPEYNWSIKTLTFGKVFDYFYYVMTKGEDLSADDVRLQEDYKQRCNHPPTIKYHSDSENEDYLLAISITSDD